MKCEKCGMDFSFGVWEIHVPQCPGKASETEPKEERIEEEADPIESVPKEAVKRGRRPRA